MSFYLTFKGYSCGGDVQGGAVQLCVHSCVTAGCSIVLVLQEALQGLGHLAGLWRHSRHAGQVSRINPSACSLAGFRNSKQDFLLVIVQPLRGTRTLYVLFRPP